MVMNISIRYGEGDIGSRRVTDSLYDTVILGALNYLVIKL